MKKNTFLAFSLLIFIGFAACKGKQETDSQELQGWTLVWEDDFNNGLDENNWSKIPRAREYSARYMSNSDGLYVSHEGNLVLRAVNNSAENAELPFLTGGITSEGKKTIKPGSRIEVRARMTPASGVSPYISLLPSDKSENISILVMERFGFDEFVYQSITSDYTKQGMADNPASNVLVGVKPGQYHTYGVETYADSIVFFVDDIRTKKYPRILTDMEGQFPFYDKEFNLFMGVRVNSDADPAGLPADLYIDRVRYYEPSTAAAQ